MADVEKTSLGPDESSSDGPEEKDAYEGLDGGPGPGRGRSGDEDRYQGLDGGPGPDGSGHSADNPYGGQDGGPGRDDLRGGND